MKNSNPKISVEFWTMYFISDIIFMEQRLKSLYFGRIRSKNTVFHWNNV